MPEAHGLCSSHCSPGCASVAPADTCSRPAWTSGAGCMGASDVQTSLRAAAVGHLPCGFGNAVAGEGRDLDLLSVFLDLTDAGCSIAALVFWNQGLGFFVCLPPLGCNSSPSAPPEVCVSRTQGNDQAVVFPLSLSLSPCLARQLLLLLGVLQTAASLGLLPEPDLGGLAEPLPQRLPFTQRARPSRGWARLALFFRSRESGTVTSEPEQVGSPGLHPDSVTKCWVAWTREFNP